MNVSRPNDQSSTPMTVVAVDLATLMAQTRKKRVVVSKQKKAKRPIGKRVGDVNEETDDDGAAMIAGNSSSAAAAGSKKQKMVPFTRRYAPKRLEDVQDQEELVQTMIQFTSDVPRSACSMPHMLLYGPPGVGKTTCADLVIMKLFPDKEVREASVLKMNASDERGINAVRTRIRDFISMEPPRGAPFRLVVLDECDNMTPQAQFALRRMMEPDIAHPSPNKPRFFFMCNYVSKVIAPLVSRCHMVRFSLINAPAMKRYLLNVMRKENWIANRAVVDEIVRVSEGDMRQALTLLQSVYKLWGDAAKPIHVADAAGQVPDDKMDDFVNLLLSENCTINRVVLECRRLVLREAFCGESILKQLLPKILADRRLSETTQAQSCMLMAAAEYNMKNSADDYLQLVHVATQIRAWHRRWPPPSIDQVPLRKVSFRSDGV